LGQSMRAEEEIFDEVHRLMLASVMEERGALEEAVSRGFSSSTLPEENEALRYLLGQRHDDVAESYIYLMKLFVAHEVMGDQDADEE
jgi:hypothetical protein